MARSMVKKGERDEREWLLKSASCTEPGVDGREGGALRHWHLPLIPAPAKI